MSKGKHLQPWLLVYPVVLGTGLAVYLCVLNRPWSTECYRRDVCDAQSFVVAGELLAEGRNPYSVQERLRHISVTRTDGAVPASENPFQYPPHSLPLFAALSWTPHIAIPLFVGASTFCSLGLLGLYVWKQSGSFDMTATVLFAFGASSLIALNAALGQTGALAATLAFASLLTADKWPGLSGVLLGLLTFKPQYAVPLLVVAAVRRQGRTLAGAFSSALVLVVLSVWLFGGDLWIDFLHVLGEANASSKHMVNWSGPITYWTSAKMPAILSLGVYGGFLMAVAYVARKRQNVTLQRLQVLAMGWTPLFSPNTHPYDLLLVAPALSVAMPRTRPWRLAAGVAIASWFAIVIPLRWLFTVGLVISGVAAAGTLLRRPVGTESRTGS